MYRYVHVARFKLRAVERLNPLCITNQPLYEDGGFSGLPALFLLDQIFHRLSIDLRSDVKPCEYFDMIMGTGPGGLSDLFCTLYDLF
jgi:hypothetical protein